MGYGDVAKMIESNVKAVEPWVRAKRVVTRWRDGMNRELEYLVRVYTDAVGVRTVKGFVRKASAWMQ